MTDVVVTGGGICGLLTSLLLARDGYEVLVLERDGSDLPVSLDDAWSAWSRPGVPQFHQTHNFHPRFRELLDAELPDVRTALESAGGTLVNYLDLMPPTVPDRTPRPGDERFQHVTGRRTTFEHVIGDAARSEARVTVRRGARVSGLLPGPQAIAGVPHVAGVRLEHGEEIRVPLVVDATGRRAGLAERLATIGARPPEYEQDEWGFTYYTRYFSGTTPALVMRPLLHLGTFSVLTMPADNGTWSITVFVSSKDRPLKNLRHADRWTALVRACPLQAHWLDGEPMTDVMPMSGVVNSRRVFAVDGAPIVTGLAPVADAYASTNPSLGRGISLGTMHAVALRNTVRGLMDQPATFARVWHETTEEHLIPWYRAQVEMDRERFCQIEAARAGEPLPVSSEPKAKIRAALQTAAAYDPDVYRAALEIIGCLATPQEILERHGMLEKVLTASDGRDAPVPPGPSREDVLEIVAA